MTPNFLELESLAGGYGRVTVVHGVSLTIPSNRIHCVIGKNGMGKSTLLKLIMGLLPRSSGRIILDKVELPPNRVDRVYDNGVSYIAQEQALFQDLTVLENMRLGALRMSAKQFRLRQEEVCDLFPVLGRRLSQRAGTLSGGEQKMLLITRALIPQPRMLILDEISEGIQPMVVDRIAEILSNAREFTTMLMVEQNLNLAFAVSDTITVLENGLVVEEIDVAASDAKTRAERSMSI